VTPEELVRVRVDALDAAVRTEPYVDAGELTEELVEQRDAALLVRAERFERWILDPFTSRAKAAPIVPGLTPGLTLNTSAQTR